MIAVEELACSKPTVVANPRPDIALELTSDYSNQFCMLSWYPCKASNHLIKCTYGFMAGLIIFSLL